MRTCVDTQQSYENRYLFSAIAPVTGESFHLSGIERFDTGAAQTFLHELKKKYSDTTVILIWDNAPCHRPRVHREIPGLMVLFLPPYSPELNPTERFFEELRKATANRIFKTVAAQEHALEKKLSELADDLEAMKRLLGYDWILKQYGEVN